VATGRPYASSRHRRRRLAGAAAAFLLIAGSTPLPGYAQETEEFDEAYPDPSAIPEDQALAQDSAELEAVAIEPEEEEIGTGLASWYGSEFAGRRTASGERFDPAGYTAAHRSLPFGSMVRVTRLDTGRSVIVRINDRGPFTGGRVIDLSQAAAREIGLIGPGRGQVSLALVSD